MRTHKTDRIPNMYVLVKVDSIVNATLKLRKHHLEVTKLWDVF